MSEAKEVLATTFEDDGMLLQADVTWPETVAHAKPKKPHRFNIPLTDKLRGYSGYNEKYAAKSDFLRRTNVWDEDGQPNPKTDPEAIEYRLGDVWDETEILRGKRHVCEKARRVNEIPVEVHTVPGERVIDLFAGSASFSEAARGLGRKWVAVEMDPVECKKITDTMGAPYSVKAESVRQSEKPSGRKKREVIEVG